MTRKASILKRDPEHKNNSATGPGCGQSALVLGPHDPADAVELERSPRGKNAVWHFWQAPTRGLQQVSGARPYSLKQSITLLFRIAPGALLRPRRDAKWLWNSDWPFWAHCYQNHQVIREVGHSSSPLCITNSTSGSHQSRSTGHKQTARPAGPSPKSPTPVVPTPVCPLTPIQPQAVSCQRLCFKPELSTRTFCDYGNILCLHCWHGSHMWLWGLKALTATQELNSKFYFILTDLKLNSHLQLVTIIPDGPWWSKPTAQSHFA